jgi:hypothetical protein
MQQIADWLKKLGLPEYAALAPLFIVATTWPEVRPPWGMRSHHATGGPRGHLGSSQPSLPAPNF